MSTASIITECYHQPIASYTQRVKYCASPDRDWAGVSEMVSQFFSKPPMYFEILSAGGPARSKGG